MMLVTRILQTDLQKGRELEKKRKNTREIQYLSWTAIQGIDRKEILVSALNKFIMLAFKIYLYAKHQWNRSYHM